MKALILSANDFEDSELLVPYDRLKQAGVDVEVASVSKGTIRGKHGCQIAVDKTLDEVQPREYDLLVVPGGRAPAALRTNEAALEIAASFLRTNKLVAAICHGPQLLVSAGLLRNRRATCYQSVAPELKQAGAAYEDKDVVVDGNLITSRKPGDLPAFMREIMKMLKTTHGPVRRSQRASD
jgi:protease I